MGYGLYRLGQIFRLASPCIFVTFSGYFIWFMTRDLAPFFSSQHALNEKMTKIRVCVASFVLQMLCSVWLTVRAGLDMCAYPHWDTDPGRRNRGGGCFFVHCFQLLYVAALIITTSFATAFAWRWWHALHAQGEDGLAYDCRFLAIYNLVMLCLGTTVPLIWSSLVRADVIVRPY